LASSLIDIADPAAVAEKLPQFKILELIGRGGMGVVYKARQLQLDRVIALKILPPADALSTDFVARFTREARALAKLSHPNIVNVHDFGETGGLYFIVMEYVDGANLRQLLDARKLTAAEALAIVPKICDALQYAHDEGLVHRDIKPENLLIVKKGRIKVADFGLAKLLRREPLDMTLTLSGMSLGTLRYMAPEQMDTPETVDHRADLYSLGVVIYEMLTGETPVGRFELPSQKAQVDVRLDQIVLHALEREPSRRYQHASEVRDDLENVTGKPNPAPPPQSVVESKKSRSPGSFAEPGILLLALCLFSVLGNFAFIAWSGNNATISAIPFPGGAIARFAPTKFFDPGIVFWNGQLIAAVCVLSLVVVARGIVARSGSTKAAALIVAGAITAGASAHFLATFRTTHMASAALSWHDFQAVAENRPFETESLAIRGFVAEHPGYVGSLASLNKEVIDHPPAFAYARDSRVDVWQTEEPGPKWTLFFGVCALLYGLAELIRLLVRLSKPEVKALFSGAKPAGPNG